MGVLVLDPTAVGSTTVVGTKKCHAQQCPTSGTSVQCRILYDSSSSVPIDMYDRCYDPIYDVIQ